ncbi:2OG-Fe(II) oxygenase [Streptomyces cinnamoneus]|uniref:2OG-Fe(II) oxygenase n=1 Tax=Streptomyces cinnamoneus TaxID=53446 RepID=UPI0034164B0D
MGGFTMEPTSGVSVGIKGLPAAKPQSPDVVLPAPVCRFENFLGAAAADALLDLAISRQADFARGTVMDPLTGELSYKGRESLVLPADVPDFLQRLADCLPQATALLGLEHPLSQATTVLTAHGSGGHFDIHTDAIKVTDVATALSAVYYLHRRPRPFTGGHLKLYDTLLRDGQPGRAETYRVIEPDHDTIVFFPASTFHEVTTSTCPTGHFGDHRFTLTTWLSTTGTPPAPQPTSPVLRAMAQAAEHTRPLPGLSRAHHGATPRPLPPPTTGTR